LLTTEGVERDRIDPDVDLEPRTAAFLFVGLLGVAALVRLALWVSFAGLSPQVWDERDYDTLATNLVRSGEFSFAPGRPVSLRPPLYPALISLIYRVAGIGNYQAVRLAQAVLSLLTIAVVFGFGRSLYSRRVGLVAAGMMSFYPSLLFYNNLLLTEVLFTFLLCGGTWLMLVARERRSLGLLATGGVLLGLGALTRSVLWPFPVVLGGWLFSTWPGTRWRAALGAVILITAFAATLAPWTLRNARLERTFQPVDCMGGRNLMMGNYEYTPMFRAWDAIGVTGDRSWNQVLAASDPAVIGMTQGQLDKRAMKYAIQYAISHPWLTVQRDIVKFFNFWGLEREVLAGIGNGQYGRWSSPAVLAATLAIVGSFVLVVLSGMFGASVVPPRAWQDHALILLVIAFLTAIHTASFGHSRYHLPLIPLILPYSAALLVSRERVWSRRTTRPFWIAGSLASLFLVAWALEVFVVYRSEVSRMISAVV
jgi:4-amino-4-deoxy-L-arabinose transferase-like glycosyltransferase